MNLQPIVTKLIDFKILQGHKNKILKTCLFVKKAPLQRQELTCKASTHVKYNPYNTLESKQVPKSTVKFTLPWLEMWRRG